MLKFNKVIHFFVFKRQLFALVTGGEPTGDTALRLGRFFGMATQFWLNLQNRYDLEVTEDMLIGRLDKEMHALNSHAA